MPYDYRKLTPEEKQEVLRQRSERGYPLHSPPHPFRFSGYYLITASNFEHHAIMGDPARRTDFEARMIKTMESIGAGIPGWVVLPNHYHILIGIESFDQISGALKQLHGATSYEWNRTDHAKGRRVWYRFVDRMIRNETHYYQSINYIHFNPIKHGCATDAYEWPWSSLGMYLDSQGREWLREKWSKYPIGEFGQGWDDEEIVNA